MLGAGRLRGRTHYRGHQRQRSSSTPCCRSRGRQVWLECRDTGRSVAVGQWARSANSGSTPAEILTSGMAGLRGTTDVGGLRRRNEEFPRADVQSSGSPEARRPERTAAVQRIEPSRSTLLGHTPGVRLASETARPTQEWIRQRNLHNAFLTSAINRSMLAFGLAATLRNHCCPAIVVVDAAPAGSCCNTLSNVSVSLGRQTTIPVCGSA